MRQLYIFIAIALYSMSCSPEAEDQEQTTPPDTIVISEPDTIWMDKPGRSDTVVVEIPQDEQQDNTAPEKNWTAGKISREHQVKGNAVVQDIRLAEHGDYERLVVEFDGQIPPYEIEYIDEPYTQCGSGKQQYLEGDGLLKIHLRNATAHTEQGAPTAKRKYSALKNIREAQVACDYEGHVEILAGVGSPNRFAAFELQNPPRLVVDVRK